MTQIEHLLQTAEAIRRDEKPEVSRLDARPFSLYIPTHFHLPVDAGCGPRS